MSSAVVDSVKSIIKNNIYLTLATGDKEPWAAPLYYCIDDNLNFYFISQIDSLHIKHIMQNPVVAFAIFDSTAKEGTGIGIQATGSVVFLETEEEIKEALKFYHTIFISCTPKDFIGDKPYRLFKLTPKKIFTQDPNSEIDKRIEVPLKELK